MLIMWIGVDVLNQKQMLVKIGSVVFVAAVQYLLNKFVTYKK